MFDFSLLSALKLGSSTYQNQLSNIPDLRIVQNSEQPTKKLIFTKNQAYQRGTSIIDALVFKLIKDNAELHEKEEIIKIFEKFTQADREATSPILLKKLANSLLKLGDKNLKQKYLYQLIQLQNFWNLYKEYVNKNWNDNDEEKNIKCVATAAKSLIKGFKVYGWALNPQESDRKQKGQKRRIFHLENKKIHLLDRAPSFTNFKLKDETKKKDITFFHIQIPVNYLTQEQLEKEIKSHPYLKKLKKEKIEEILQRTRPCYCKTGTGLANFVIDITGYFDENKNQVIHSFTTQHSSFAHHQIKDEKARQPIIRENIKQWATIIAQWQISQNQDINLNDYNSKNPLKILAATISVQSPVTDTLTALTDRDENQGQQISEVEKVLGELQKTPIEIQVKNKQGNDVKIYISLQKVIFMVMGINKGRFFEDKKLVTSINKPGFNSLKTNIENFIVKQYAKQNAKFEKAINDFEKSKNLINLGDIIKQYCLPKPETFLNAIEKNKNLTSFDNLIKQHELSNIDDPLLKDVLELYNIAHWLYTNRDYSEEQNHHFQAIFLIINQLIGFMPEVWCIDTKDRSMIVKILAESYRVFKTFYGHYPHCNNKEDVKELERIENMVNKFSLYSKIPGDNTPGLDGAIRRYFKNDGAIKILARNVYGVTAKNLDDRNKHIENCELGRKVSGLAADIYKGKGNFKHIKNSKIIIVKSLDKNTKLDAIEKFFADNSEDKIKNFLDIKQEPSPVTQIGFHSKHDNLSPDKSSANLLDFGEVETYPLATTVSLSHN